MTPRERLLKRKPRTVTVEGEEFLIRMPTVREAMEFESLLKSEETQRRALSYFVAHCLVNDDGSEVFESESDPALDDIPIDMLQGLCQAIGKMSKVPSLEKIEKNSEATN